MFPKRLSFPIFSKKRIVTFSFIFSNFLTSPPLLSANIQIQGSSTVGPIVAEAAEELREKENLKITVDTFGGSAAGLSSVASKTASLGMISKEISKTDRQKYSKVPFQTFLIGYDAVALTLSKSLYEQGVQDLSLSQLRQIYEKKITNWKQVGGPDQRLIFLNKEPGRGTWEVFVKSLYGKTSLAPLISHLEVGSNEEARNKVKRTPGALTLLSVAWVNQDPELRALSLKETDASPAVAPTQEMIRLKKYPLARPLFLVSANDLNDNEQKLVDFLLSERGQKIVESKGYLKLATPHP